MSDLTDADLAVHQLDSLIEYQDGSVVSRTVIKKKSGTVTLFAFDRGEELSEHTSPYEALVHILEGEADIFISGEKYHVPAGNMIVLPADDPHALKAPQPFKMLLTMIREK